MKRNYIRILVAFFGLAAFSAASQGQDADRLVVKIPYEFVVGSRTLPAGTYKIGRINDRDVGELVMSSFENRAIVLVLPSTVDIARAEHPAVTFQQIGDQHFLDKIQTAGHVFTIPVTSSDVLEAANKRQRSLGRLEGTRSK